MDVVAKQPTYAYVSSLSSYTLIDGECSSRQRSIGRLREFRNVTSIRELHKHSPRERSHERLTFGVENDLTERRQWGCFSANDRVFLQRASFSASRKASSRSRRRTFYITCVTTAPNISEAKGSDLVTDVPIFTLSTKCSSLAELWPLCAKEYGDLPALNDPHCEEPTQLSFKQLSQTIRTFGAGLQSLGLGDGERVALFSENSYRWFITDQAIMLCGAVDAVRGSKAPIDELSYIVEQSESEGLVVENFSVLKTLVPELKNPAAIRFVVVLWGEVQPSIDGLSCPVLSFNEVLGRGVTYTAFQSVKRQRQDLATLIYTSGTTGKPKAVMLCHENLLSQLTYLEVCYQAKPGDRVVGLLPPWHIYERASEYFFLSRGCTQVYTNVRLFRKDLAEYQPQCFAAVPRVFETIYHGVIQKFGTLPPPARAVVGFFMLLSKWFVYARRVVTNKVMRRKVPSVVERVRSFLVMCLLWPLHKLADLVFYKKIRQGLGGKFVAVLSGGGSLSPTLDDFFELVGISILVGYGLTETSPVLSARRYADNIRGTAGPPLTRTEVRVVHPETLQPLPQGETGLIVGRGPQVMLGYFKDPEATQKALTPDGWFNTGDRGWISYQGHVVITGRFKETIVLSNGENVEPAAIEDAILESPIVHQVVAVGQDERCLGALVVPNFENLRSKLLAVAQKRSRARSVSPLLPSSNGIAATTTRETQVASARTDVQQVMEKLGKMDDGVQIDPADIVHVFEEEIARYNRKRKAFRPDERVGTFRFVSDPFTEENGLMTQTLKIKRNQVMDKYESLISGMYN
mmetsp:Transcript_27846/g.45234  ORF Transcript_27846/g.45234 Transcript_27846/m.45234 type:complete len:802 (-) Transcript_27846:257-2662(-)|eukprot:CAMPEP_0184334452 /NCGR_PEP_ID=MMETSP1089-20130417/3235_1 /TAXON_ID=38269 ORGANISM="Gloeochaete wittrockiana, Strain SAG46.84" /NCGR_SAMPLE_ID=MMETSP1089 /ASSEMBLY_ACC=CAM_ASM_000445 /LENGTH=801 /DNA_ID=CAMNT_0026658717 /DNA_START=38 /DNA_END=2443 /DNA_ORIENTATION=+